MTDLPTLAARVEKEQSRELDAEIGRLLGIKPKVTPVYRRNHYPLQKIRDKEEWSRYTTSIDAAASLMPEGWTIRSIEQSAFKGIEHWRCCLWKRDRSSVISDAPTEPQARTAAALRAMEAEGG